MSLDTLWEQALSFCGRLFFSRMRPFFFFTLAVLPVLGAVFFLFLESGRVQDLEERFAAASAKGKIALERKAKKERFLRRYSNSDPYFLDQQIESFPFLEKEKKQIESWLSHPVLLRKEPLKERFSFLTGGENRLSFAEENLRASSRIKETDEKQRRPVQMDESDLQKILALIEDVQVGPYLPAKSSPQLVVKELRARKTATPLQGEVFEVEMDLLKREFTTQ